MPKAKKSSKKDTSSFIKKVASAGRGGDTELAYLSPKARDLLKNLGGSGTKNPKTGLKEYKAAAAFGRRAAQESLDEFNALRDQTMRQMPQGSLAPAQPLEFDTIMPTYEDVAIGPQQAAPVPQYNAAQNFAQLMEVGKPGQEPMASTPAAITQARAQMPYTTQFDPSRLMAPAPAPAPAAPDLQSPPDLSNLDLSGLDLSGINLSGIGLGGSYMPAAPTQPAAAQQRALEDLAVRPDITNPWQPYGDQARRIAEEEIARRGAEEAARRAQEEEAARQAAAQEAARRAAEEESRRAAEMEASRRAAEEEARRRAEQDEAARRAAEEARRVAPPVPVPVPVAPPQLPGPVVDVQPPAAPPPAQVVPGAGDVRTKDFIDQNMNGIDDRNEGPSRSTGGGFSGLFGVVDPNSDVGRLLARLGQQGGGRVSPGAPGGEVNPQISAIPTTGYGQGISMFRPGELPMPVTPTSGYGSIGSMPSVTGVAGPFEPTSSIGSGPQSLQPTSSIFSGNVPTPGLPTPTLPTQALAANPNLSPTILGGTQNLGYYTDRFGNRILSPGAVRPPGFAKGGEADAELLKQLEAVREAEGFADLDSARAMLDQLSEAPAESQTEVSLSPTARSVKRVSRRPIRQQTDRGTAKGMAMELEQVTETKLQGPRTKGQTEEARQKMELVRETLGIPTLTRAGLAREGDLMTKRFAEGGEAQSSAREKLDALLESAGRGARSMKRGAAEMMGVADVPARAERESVAAFGLGESGGGKADAMRHLMYQADLTRKFNPTTANIVSRLYELTSPGQSSAEYEMDLYNDALGREIGQRAKSDEDVVKLAREYVEKNKARILPKEERTGYATGGVVKRKGR